MSELKAFWAECCKIKGSLFPVLHILLPIFYGLLMLAGRHLTFLNKLSDLEMASAYLTLLGACLPLVISLSSAILSDIEASAGHFQVMLAGHPSKLCIYLNKMLLMGLAASLSFLMAIAFLHELVPNLLLVFYFYAFLLLLTSSFFLYLLHFWIALRFGSGSSIALGIAEMLLAFLFLTGLGDGVWIYTPAAWPSRLTDTLVAMLSYPDTMQFYLEIRSCLLFLGPVSLFSFFFSLIYLQKFEGPRNFE